METIEIQKLKLWFSKVGPRRLSKNAIWKKLTTHYKTTLVHPGTLSRETGLKNTELQRKKFGSYIKKSVHIHDHLTHRYIVLYHLTHRYIYRAYTRFFI